MFWSMIFIINYEFLPFVLSLEETKNRRPLILHANCLSCKDFVRVLVSQKVQPDFFVRLRRRHDCRCGLQVLKINRFKLQGSRLMVTLNGSLFSLTERGGRSESYGSRTAHPFIQEQALSFKNKERIARLCFVGSPLRSQCLLLRGKNLAVLRVSPFSRPLLRLTNRRLKTTLHISLSKA